MSDEDTSTAGRPIVFATVKYGSDVIGQIITNSIGILVSHNISTYNAEFSMPANFSAKLTISNNRNDADDYGLIWLKSYTKRKKIASRKKARKAQKAARKMERMARK